MSLDVNGDLEAIQAALEHKRNWLQEIRGELILRDLAETAAARELIREAQISVLAARDYLHQARLLLPQEVRP